MKIIRLREILRLSYEGSLFYIYMCVVGANLLNVSDLLQKRIISASFPSDRRPLFTPNRSKKDKIELKKRAENTTCRGPCLPRVLWRI